MYGSVLLPAGLYLFNLSTTCPWTSTTARRASYSEVHEELLRTGGNTAAACAERLYSSHLECS